jgi:outer membrane protein OmpA-like peptidoglycan-associated protein
MKVKNKIVIGLLGILLVMLTAVKIFAQERDIRGSKDHPIISRYPGSVIIQYRQREFDEYTLLLGPIMNKKPTKFKKLEGRVTNITYKAPKERSPLEVWKNYEEAIKKADFEILYMGKGEDIFDYPYVIIYKLHGLSAVYFGGRMKKDYRYLSAKIPNEETYLSLLVGTDDWGRPLIQLDIIEGKEMERGLITAQNIAGEIERKGHISIYGIYFDFDKADIKPESEPTIKEIAKFLKDNPDINLFIVGHTDNIGEFEYNMDLSRRRAEAVVKMLISKYGIDAKRLHPIGVGPICPVASNKTEEGRAKNRRVELVEK